MSGGVHVDPNDTFGKSVGVLAAIIAVLLSLFTINAHRAHTHTIVLQNEANDQWAYYQAKRIRDYQLNLNLDLLGALPNTNPKAHQLIDAYGKKHLETLNELEKIKNIAQTKNTQSKVSEKKALRFDLSEGILELGLVMSSLFFIARKKMFPAFGIIFAIVGTLLGLSGFIIH